MNDAQRKVMEQTLETMEFFWRDVSMNDYAWQRLETSIAALRAQLDAPAEKVEPVAWLAPDGTVRNRPGARTFKEWALAIGDFKPLFLAPPDVAQIAAQARAEAIEECAKVCESSVLPFDIDVWRTSTKKEMSALTAQALALKVRALKSGTTPTEGENNGTR